MGLDMYLRADLYLSGYEFGPDKVKNQYRAVREALGLEASPEDPSLTVSTTAVYWRKANAIHKWFVDNCQDGIDECQQAYVARRDLESLLYVCQRALDTGNSALLPTGGGFFFGSTEYDDWYWENIKYTVKSITKALNEFDERYTFSYQSSW